MRLAHTCATMCSVYLTSVNQHDTLIEASTEGAPQGGTQWDTTSTHTAPSKWSAH